MRRTIDGYKKCDPVYVAQTASRVHIQHMLVDAVADIIEMQEKQDADALDAARYRALKKHGVFQISANSRYGLAIPTWDATLDNLEQVAEWLINNENECGNEVS